MEIQKLGNNGGGEARSERQQEKGSWDQAPAVWWPHWGGPWLQEIGGGSPSKTQTRANGKGKCIEVMAGEGMGRVGQGWLGSVGWPLREHVWAEA